MSKILSHISSVLWLCMGNGQAKVKLKEAFTVISFLQHEDLSAVGFSMSLFLLWKDVESGGHQEHRCTM